jgi:hypothetical protein
VGNETCCFEAGRVARRRLARRALKRNIERLYCEHGEYKAELDREAGAE